MKFHLDARPQKSKFLIRCYAVRVRIFFLLSLFGGGRMDNRHRFEAKLDSKRNTGTSSVLQKSTSCSGINQ